MGVIEWCFDVLQYPVLLLVCFLLLVTPERQAEATSHIMVTYTRWTVKEGLDETFIQALSGKMGSESEFWLINLCLSLSPSLALSPSPIPLSLPHSKTLELFGPRASCCGLSLVSTNQKNNIAQQAWTIIKDRRAQSVLNGSTVEMKTGFNASEEQPSFSPCVDRL